MNEEPNNRKFLVLSTDFQLFTAGSRARDSPEVPFKGIMCASYPKLVTEMLCTCYIFQKLPQILCDIY